MRTLPAHIQNVIASDSITLATCWRLKLQNGSTLRFTDHHDNLTVGAETFSAGGSFSRSAVSFALGLSEDNLDVTGVLGDDSITDTDLMAGKYDYAEVEIFLVDYLAPNSGIVELCAGQLGEIELGEGGFSVQMIGHAARLAQTDIEVCSATCRAVFGDEKCGINLASHTASGSVTSVLSGVSFDTNLTPAINHYAGGHVTFTSGENSGLILEVKGNNTAGVIELFLPSPYAIQASDTFTITRGCDKRADTCKNTYSNIINFRGEPFVPGNDKILAVNNAKESKIV